MVTAVNTARGLPHWDLSGIYPSLESPEFLEGMRAFAEHIRALAEFFEQHQIGAAAQSETLPLSPEQVQTLETVIERMNEVLQEMQTLIAYIRSFVTTNSRDNLAQARMSELQQHTVRLSQLDTRLTAWIGSLDVEGLIRESKVAAAHAFMLRKAKTQSQHQMSPAEEELAAQLSLSGGVAWGKLHGNVTSQLTVPVEVEGRVHELPMSAIRNLAFDPNRDVRRRAYEAELAAWQRAAVPLAAALNSIKGEVNTLSRRRNWETPLDETIFDSNIDRQTLDAMMEAARESFPDFRRYLRAKARALSVPQLAWYDLYAPVGRGARPWEWNQAAAFVVEQFGTYSPRLRDLAARAFRENWVDAEPRPGKRDGAFCMAVRDGESRVLSNYKPSYGGMSTLAHELGHAYHNLVKAPRTMLQRSTPMTLAETASIFCETIVRQSALKQADPQEQLVILEASLQDQCQVVVDISSRFLFENGVFERRLDREQSSDEFCALMLEAQRATFGDGLDSDKLHPYMWAVKPHYYSTGLSYYNFPYMFGQLFGLGLYARYEQDPEAFRAGYDELLSSTGMAGAATLAARFGIDLHSPAFWRASLDTARRDVDRFETLVAA